MHLVLEVSPELEARLRQAAAREGREVADYLVEAATETLLTLGEVDAAHGSYDGHAADIIELGLLDFRTIRGQKFVSSRDLARYQSELAANPQKAMDEMVGLNQLQGQYN